MSDSKPWNNWNDLREALYQSAELLEEAAVLMAEIHIRFHVRIMNDDCTGFSELTFGDAAKLYNEEAKKIRELLKNLHITFPRKDF